MSTHDKKVAQIKFKAHSSARYTEADVVLQLIDTIRDESVRKTASSSSGLGLIRQFKYVYDYEYDVNEGRAEKGVGDLILANGRDEYAIVEVKCINYAPGKTARKARNKNKNNCRNQAKFYLERCGFQWAIWFAVWNNRDGSLHIEAGDRIRDWHGYPKTVFDESCTLWDGDVDDRSDHVCRSEGKELDIARTSVLINRRNPTSNFQKSSIGWCFERDKLTTDGKGHQLDCYLGCVQGC